VVLCYHHCDGGILAKIPDRGAIYPFRWRIDYSTQANVPWVPKINSALVSGKNVFVYAQVFDVGAVILITGSSKGLSASTIITVAGI
jgi:hypothetical protein